MAIQAAPSEPRVQLTLPLLSLMILGGQPGPERAMQVQLADQLLREARVDFEIIVQDDIERVSPQSSTTTRRLGELSASGAKAQLLAEALPRCRGEYVWSLAAEDEVCPAGLAELLVLLRRGDDDIIVFSSFSNGGESAVGATAVAGRALPRFYGREVRGSIATFIQHAGFFYGLGDASAIVLRRSVASIEALKEYGEIAPQDVHVAWLLAMGEGRRFRFVNRPLVCERRTPSDIIAAEKAVALAGWEDDLRRLAEWLCALDKLVAVGAITLKQIRCAAAGFSGPRASFVGSLEHRLLSQLEHGKAPISADDAALLNRWLEALCPPAVSLRALIDEALIFTNEHEASLLRIAQDSRGDQTVRTLAKELRARVSDARRAVAEERWYARFYFETFQLYDIYDFGDDWVATQVGFEAKPSVLEVIDLPSLVPAFLRADSYDELRRQIEVQPLTLERFAMAGWNGAGECAPLVSSTSGDEDAAAEAAARRTRNEGREVIARLRAEILRQDGQLADLYMSRSWRVTEPLRRVGSRLARQAPRTMELAPTFSMGRSLDLCDAAADVFLPRGFSTPEAWGRWTDGPLAVFRCRHASRWARGTFEFWPEMVWPTGGGSGRISLSVNGGRARTLTVEAGKPQRLQLSRREMASSELEIVLRPHLTKGRTDAPVDDPRQLGLGLTAIRVAWAAIP